MAFTKQILPNISHLLRGNLLSHCDAIHEAKLVVSEEATYTLSHLIYIVSNPTFNVILGLFLYLIMIRKIATIYCVNEIHPLVPNIGKADCIY